MVIFCVISCCKRSGRDDVSFYRIPAVVTHRGKEEEELLKERRAGFLAAISRIDLDSNKRIENVRICSRHFISGAPAAVLDRFNADWLPTLHLSHRKRRAVDNETVSERFKWRKARGQDVVDLERKS